MLTLRAGCVRRPGEPTPHLLGTAQRPPAHCNPPWLMGISPQACNAHGNSKRAVRWRAGGGLARGFAALGSRFGFLSGPGESPWSPAERSCSPRHPHQSWALGLLNLKGSFLLKPAWSMHPAEWGGPFLVTPAPQAARNPVQCSLLLRLCLQASSVSS